MNHQAFVQFRMEGGNELVTLAGSHNLAIYLRQDLGISPHLFNIPGKSAKLYKLILDLPIVGTLLYNFAAARKSIEKLFTENYFYNLYDVKPHFIDQYYEAAHLGGAPKAIYSSELCNFTKCSISRTLEKIDNSIYLLGGEGETDIEATIKEYTTCNPAIESSAIPGTRHLPQLEKPESVCDVITMFFN